MRGALATATNQKLKREDAHPEIRDALAFGAWRSGSSAPSGFAILETGQQKRQRRGAAFCLSGMIAVQRSNDPMRGGNAGTSM
ncbi:hypothetical protein [Ensifer adhaerens]|uniref:hypothetical protein n=1 Tax=Ensifer adhaerens TaxID=106592 RepID=UPI001C4E117C|nr:hypothetical protein [Ensifer adhaerens]MBW0365768.1 hypothetical protein [Ensifer adhaerens]UCM20323.1 hypothetical protein LDL63_01585 [Ensifer adhaerens]